MINIYRQLKLLNMCEFYIEKKKRPKLILGIEIMFLKTCAYIPQINIPLALTSYVILSNNYSYTTHFRLLRMEILFYYQIHII